MFYSKLHVTDQHAVFHTVKEKKKDFSKFFTCTNLKSNGVNIKLTLSTLTPQNENYQIILFDITKGAKIELLYILLLHNNAVHYLTNTEFAIKIY